MSNKSKYVVAYVCPDLKVYLKTILETTERYDTYTQATLKYKQLQWCNTPAEIYQVFDSFIYNHTRRRLEYFKQDNTWIQIYAVADDHLLEAYYDLQGNLLKIFDTKEL